MTQSTSDSNVPSSRRNQELEHSTQADLVEQKRAERERARAEQAARMAERDNVADRERAEQVERANDSTPNDSSEAFGTSYLADGKTEAAWQHWRELQSNFVDDPQSAVKQAHALVGDLIDEIVCRFETEREQLESRWSSGQEVSTEDLRRGLQRYRDFFGRLLANVGDAPAE